MGTGHTAGGYWSYSWWVLAIQLVGTDNTAGGVILLVILLVGTCHTAGGY